MAGDPTFSFCPVCGGRLERRVLRDNEPERLVCAACTFVLYLDPKVAVGTILRDEGGRVLLLRRAIEPGHGKWVFPGGYVDRGEVVERAAVREALEETGLDITLGALVGIYSYASRTPIVIVFGAEVAGGTLRLDHESVEARWFAPADIPWSDLAFPSTEEALRHWVQRCP
jgi:8-oxo-dGTP diphosphatase